MKQFLTLQEFASFIVREELPENFIWAASPGDHSFVFVTLKSGELRQLARKALCFALSTDYLPYEDAVNVVRARELTALGRALVDQDEFSIAEKSVGPIILIEGLSATGKTTVSRKIAGKLGVGVLRKKAGCGRFQPLPAAGRRFVP